jgi:hypothetical protein
VRQWQNDLAGQLGYESVMACRSIVFRILQPTCAAWRT